jgi:hypothetical protein
MGYQQGIIMASLRTTALENCSSILSRYKTDKYFDEYCSDLQGALAEMARLGRYGDIGAVMMNFEKNAQNHCLSGDQILKVLSFMPVSLDAAPYFLLKEHHEVAASLANNLIEHENLSGEVESLSSVVINFCENGCEDAACTLLSAFLAANDDDPALVVQEVFMVLQTAIGDGYPGPMNWAWQNEEVLVASFVRDRTVKHMETGIDFYEWGLKLLGEAIIRSRPHAHGFELCHAASLIRMVPGPTTVSPNSQHAIMTYMLSQTSLGEEWLDVTFDIKGACKRDNETAQSCVSLLNRQGVTVAKESIEFLCAALLSNATSTQDLDAVKLQINKLMADIDAPVITAACHKIIPAMIQAEPIAGAPAILYFDKMLNKGSRLDYADKAQIIAAQIDKAIPDMSLSQLASYIDRVLRFPVDRRAIGLHIDKNWGSASEAVKEVYRDRTPGNIAVMSKPLKGSVIERDMGL